MYEEGNSRRKPQALEINYDLAANKGEFLMKTYLDLRVSTDNFVDNAHPGFLTNPMTGEPLEHDRYYMQGVAFEFNGPQHMEQTRRFSSERALRHTRNRDLVKKGRKAAPA